MGAFTLSACSFSSKYTIDGYIPHIEYNNKMVYLEDVETSEILDSTVVANSLFKFEGEAKEPQRAFVQIDRYNYCFVILEKGKIQVNLHKHSATGTPLNNALNDYYHKLEDMQNEFKAEYDKIQDQFADSTDKSQVGLAINKFNNEVYLPKKKQYLLDFFLEHTNSLPGIEPLKNLVELCSIDEMEELLPKVGSNLRGIKEVEEIVTYIEAKKKTDEGQPFVDFTIETEEGGEVSLSDYVGKGKYVLVDFWASWCGPCKAEIPNLIETYAKYKDKNFEILGIAVWDKTEDTKVAIEELGITWPQILNAQSIPTDIYAITGVPHIILFGPDGTILKRGLRGDAIQTELAKWLD